MVPPLQHKLPRALQISVTPPHACPAPMRPTPTDTYLPPSLVPLGASAGERTTFRSTGQRPDPTQPGSPQPSPQLPRGLSCSRPATQSSPRPQPTGQPNPSPQRAHRPIKPLAEPDQPMADAKPNLVHNPAPSDQPCTGPNSMAGQPSPAPQAHNPSWAQPSPAHGSQHATQPSLHSQPTAQPEYSSQPTAQAQPPSPACALNPQPSTAQPPPRSPQPKLGPAQPSPRSPHWIIDSPFSQVLPLVD